MIFLNKDAIQKIDQGVIQTAVKSAYLTVLNNDFNMPNRMHVGDKENMLLLMPCFSEKYFATKLVSVFPGAKEKGLPMVNGMVVLCDNETGQPVAIFDGASLTAQRTGAVGGLAVKLLSSETASTGGVFGAGVQGYNQARYLLLNRKLKTLYIYDLNDQMITNMISTLSKTYQNVEFLKAKSAIDLVKKSNIIIAATTSVTPLFEIDADPIMGKTFISIGSFRPEMQEFPSKIIENSDHIFVDTLFAIEETGDIAIPIEKKIVKKENIKDFAQLLIDNPYSDDQTILFKSVGMALFDLTVSIAIYESALENGLGQQMDY